MKYIYHHLGLGDHIICNGIVRYYSDLYGKIILFSKPHNLENVKFMYRDSNKIEVISVGHDSDIENYINTNQIENFTIKIGFENLRRFSGKSFDESFYSQCGIPFDFRFSKFYLKRDYEKENNVIKKLNPNNDPYIFVHDVNLDKVRKDLKIIQNPKEFNIFELLSLLENAEEVHLMESSIKCLVNSLKLPKPKFYYHQYVRNYDDFLNSKGLNKFEIIY